MERVNLSQPLSDFFPGGLPFYDDVRIGDEIVLFYPVCTRT